MRTASSGAAKPPKTTECTAPMSVDDTFDARVTQDVATMYEGKLGIVPEVSFIEEVLHILIEGVQIEEEIGNACEDWSNDNWVGFGYNIAELVKTLL